MSNDDTLFQHPCAHGDENGALNLTTRGMVWRRSDGASSITMLWTGIVPKSDKYQPSKGMIRIQDLHSKQFKIFKLLGEDANKVLRKFELVKSFIKHMLYQDTPYPFSSPTAALSFSSAVSREKRKHLDSDEARKELILERDPQLLKWYTELVEHKVCDKETFWQNRSFQLRDLEIEGTSTVKGMVSALLSDIDQGEFDSKGVKHIQMNHDAKAEIFMLYPAVEKDFHANVPAQMTEDEFWGKYFQQQHALHNKIQSRNEQQHQQQRKRGPAVGQQVPAFVSPFVCPDVDLTSTSGDYTPSEALDPEDYLWHPSDFLSGKYINKSTLVMQQQDYHKRKEHQHNQQDRFYSPSASVAPTNESLSTDRSVLKVGPYRVPSHRRDCLSCENDHDGIILNGSDDDCFMPLKLGKMTRRVRADGASNDSSGKRKKSNDKDDGFACIIGHSGFDRGDGLSSIGEVFPDKERVLQLMHTDLASSEHVSEDGPTRGAAWGQSKVRDKLTGAGAPSRKSELNTSVDFEEVRCLDLACAFMISSSPYILLF